MNTDIDKTLESLDLVNDDGQFATFQAPSMDNSLRDMIERTNGMQNVCQAKKENEWAVMEDNGGTLHMWVKDASGDYVFASPVMPDDVADCIDDVENASAWDADLIMLQQIINERNCTLEKARAAYVEDLSDTEDSGNGGVKTVMSNDGIDYAALGEAGLQAFASILKSDLARLKSLETEDVSLNLCPIDEEEDRIITVSHPKVLTNKDKESFDKIRAGLEWLGLETEYEEEAVASWENGYPATQSETGFRLSERFVGIAAAIL